jgi:hypothetical protein
MVMRPANTGEGRRPERSRRQPGRGRPTDHLLAELLRERQLVAVEAVVDQSRQRTQRCPTECSRSRAEPCTIWVINA